MKYLTTDEKKYLFQEIYRDHSKHRKRNIALFELTKYCALRASEITKLQMSYYDSSTQQIYCKRLKGSNSNTLKIVDRKVLNALNDYLEEREAYQITSPYIFVSQKGNPISRQRLDRMMKNYCSRAKYISPEKWHMHTLRHSRAIELIEYGFDVDDVQYWLGHKNSDNTFKYLEYTSSLRKSMFAKLEMLENQEEIKEPDK